MYIVYSEVVVFIVSNFDDFIEIFHEHLFSRNQLLLLKIYKLVSEDNV